MIAVENLGINYGIHTVFCNLNLVFKTGEISALVGPSGCGKTTLLKSILGLIEIKDGYIKINGQKITDIRKSCYEQTIGYMSQNAGLFPQYTAKENVSLVAKLKGVKDSEIQERVDELVNLVKIKPEIIHKYPAELSGGQKQRISLMRALFFNPDVILLDEPMGAIDPLVRKKCKLN